ncbi:hypothetical protein [Pseudoneobacillus sp. C159]
MKNSLFKIAVPTLAFGLAFAPIANAAPQETTSKTVVTVKTTTVKKVVVNKHVTKKEKEAIKKLASINKNVSKVEASVKKLSTATTDFYEKAVTSLVSNKVEANFYSSTSGKLKANSNQLKALKKQVDHVAKKYRGTDAVASAYKKIADQNAAISATSKNLSDLHKQFTLGLTEQEAKERFVEIFTNISKVETSVAELSKATAEFYTKAATDPSVTAKVEAEFYTSTSGKIKANQNQLDSLKKQLDYVEKFYKDSEAIATVSKKMVDLTTANSTASKTLTDLHTQFMTKVKEQEEKEKLISITNEITKAEANVAALLRSTVEFYAKAATDATITAKAEAEFYTSTSDKIKANKTQLDSLKKQLDSLAKTYKDTTVIAVLSQKIVEVTTTNATVSKTLTDLHTQFVAKVKEQEGKAKLTSITNEMAKVEADVTALLKTTAEFYAKAATDATVTTKMEAEFYTSTSGKIKANKTQLDSLKKQLDNVAKIYKDVDTVATYKKIADLNALVSVASKNVTDLHTQFVAKVKEQEAKAKLTSITNEISKVETNVAALSKATVEFYTKAATDPKVTAQVEADFYKSTSNSLLNYTKQLLGVQKQLDQFVKNYGQSVDTTAAYSKITAQNQAITLTIEALIKYHITFKPAPPTTTNP